VSFSAQGATGTFVPAACTLVAAGSDDSTCAVEFTADHAGTAIVVASFAQTASDSASSGDGAVGSSKHAVTAALVCAPASVAAGSATSCTTTVSDTAGATITPSGSVRLNATAGGSFAPAQTCTLSSTGAGQAACTVTFTPVGTQPQQITASYGGDADHVAGSASVTLNGAAPGGSPGSTAPGGTTGPAGSSGKPGATTHARPSNAFSIVKVSLNPKKGTATIQVKVPDAGRVTLSGAGIRGIGGSTSRAATIKLTIAASGKALRTLRRRHKLAVAVRIDFLPVGGVHGSATRRLTLVLRP
jgi:type VI secretion system secreted protein VgrG